MNIDKAVRLFADFINVSWAAASYLITDREYTTRESSINDWLQCNWELLVERETLGSNDHLEVYGDGADYNGASSRITDMDALANFRIVAKSKNEKKIPDVLNNEMISVKEMVFDKIVGFRDNYYLMQPEFKYVLVLDDIVERVFAIEDVEFTLHSI